MRELLRTSIALVADVSITPSISSLPGSAALQSIANGIAAWALVLSLVGLLVGAAMWALGAHAGNYQQTYSGKKTLGTSAAAAVVVGAAPALINFFFHLGQGVH
ncbi:MULTISPECIES: DUF6112 family protein [Acidithrix]|uniref:Uncharacterized protein n=1 Tax=Acidithrix ferrooxidans TaxID=1280514 RepID=A0A0D8HJ08_9ACTN|nr:MULTISPECIES: DUF6112 family protein [Acidithrix]KJF17930.1 hypothetical protein AXFE_12150 [Acidithrix ferrooxidans]CAG4933836.1 unnamed protein product [Acidithrix sp. C25]